MLTMYDVQALARLEARWLDPDCIDRPREEDEQFWEDVDRRVEEKWAEKQ